MSSKLKKLGALADIYQSEHLDGTITSIRLDKIKPSNDQPRQDRTLAVDELAASIKKDGLLSPIVVTRDGATNYRVIAGERRYHACLKLGLQEVECRIISREERDYWRIAIIENLQRENLSAQEEAIALLKLKKQENYSDADLAALVGKSRNYITEILGIAGLPVDILEECRQAGIDNKNLLIQAVQAHKRGGMNAFLDAFRAGEIRTVRAARDFVQQKNSSATPATERSGQGRLLPEESESDESASAPMPVFKAKGNVLTITCDSPDEVRKLKSLIRKHYKK